MENKLPEIQELNDVSQLMKRARFLYITNFADTLNRYAEIHFKDPLRFTAISFLITRGGSLTPTQLANLMFRSKHSITKIIDGLEKNGFIIRIRDNKDRRMVHVKLTEKGFEHAKKNMKIGDDLVKSMLFSLSDDEWDNLLGYIKKLKKSLVAKMVNV